MRQTFSGPAVADCLPISYVLRIVSGSRSHGAVPLPLDLANMMRGAGWWLINQPAQMGSLLLNRSTLASPVSYLPYQNETTLLFWVLSPWREIELASCCRDLSLSRARARELHYVCVSIYRTKYEGGSNEERLSEGRLNSLGKLSSKLHWFLLA